MINISIIGCGYWGPNLVRNFNQIENCNIKIICDLNDEKLQKMKKNYSFVKTTKDYREIFDDKEIHAIAIATHPSTHFKIAKEALIAGKHVFVEKPLCLNSSNAKELVELAEKQKLVLMVGHTFEYNSAVNKLKELIDKIGRAHV